VKTILCPEMGEARTNAIEAHIEDSRTTNWREALLLVLCGLLLEVSDMYPVRSFLQHYLGASAFSQCLYTI
jgi:hypothetical protein